MSMYEWAKKEVEIACKKENPEKREGEFDYGCACYQSALKALNNLFSALVITEYLISPIMRV